MTRLSLKCVTLGLVSVAMIGVTAVARAQDAEAARRQFLLQIPTSTGGGLADFFRGAPGANTGTPLAFGASIGDFFVAGAYQGEQRGQKLSSTTFTPNGVDDASVSVGFGFGNPNGGLSLTTVITSLSPFRGGFGDRTALSFSVSHNVRPSLAVAIGVENGIVSGGGGSGGAESFYGVVSKIFVSPFTQMSWLKAVTVSGGAGNGRFRRIEDVNSGNETVNAFASVSALVHERVSLIADYTGQDINLGFSVVPFKKIPFAITPAVADLTTMANSTPRLIIGLGIGMHF